MLPGFGEVKCWWEVGEVGSWEVPGFIQGWGTQGKSKILSFCFLMLIKGTKGQSDVNQGKEGDGWKIFLCARRDGKTLLRSSASC